MNVIAHNLLAMNAQRQYGIVNNRQAKTTEKLSSGYRINADDQGIHISWTGHNGTSYQTEKVDWDMLEANQYSFEMSDYYDKQAYPELFGANDEPLIKQKVSFRIEETATRDDIIACLNGTSMSGSASVSLAGRFEATDGNENPGEVSIHSVYMNYRSAYATRGAGNNTDGRDFDVADDAFFEPTGEAEMPI